MSRPRNILHAGDSFGRLSVRFKDGEKWRCLCDCGSFVSVSYSNLKSGNTTSCGCFHRERQKVTAKTHGGRNTRLYHVWLNMWQRCTNPLNPSYKNYGARGIYVDPPWKDFAIFRRDMREPASSKLTLERKNNNGPYSKSNCVWDTRKNQANNKRVSRMLTFNGKTQTLQRWADELGKPYYTLHARLRRGWSDERTLSS